MDALAALRTPKLFVEATPWHNGPVSHAAFPLSHKGKIKLAKAWSWSVHTLEDGQRMYRLLVAFEPTKNQYLAWLGVAFGGDQAVVARVELHATHDGWHCHWKTGPLDEVGRGVVNGPFGRERRRDCGDHDIPIGKANAFGLAYRLFNVTPQVGELGL
jgi:hypothetical protein